MTKQCPDAYVLRTLAKTHAKIPTESLSVQPNAADTAPVSPLPIFGSLFKDSSPPKVKQWSAL